MHMWQEICHAESSTEESYRKKAGFLSPNEWWVQGTTEIM